MKTPRKFTTMEVGRMLGVNYTTVNNWIRAGKLPAYQTPGGHRRIMEDELREFLSKFGMPAPPELNDRPRILIVDDEASYLNMLKRWFERYTDYNVSATGNSVEALLIAGEEKPALMLLDILMPGMDGVEVCKMIKSRPGTRVIKVIGISGKADAETRKELIAAGALECLDKSLAMPELMEIVDRYLRGRVGNRE